MLMDDDLSPWITGTIPPSLLSTPLADSTAEEIVQRLKQEADRHWHIDPNRSLEFAERIISIGRARNDSSQLALGLMARGDALKFLGRMQEAWEVLEEAASMFETAGDEVGWARTRIGRLYLGLQLNCLPIALADIERARSIFTRHGEDERLLRLDWQTAFVYLHLGEQHRALQLYESALSTAEMLGETGKAYLGSLYANVGATYSALGDFQQALSFYERARNLAIEQDEPLNISSAEGNIAEIAQSQGHYQRALRLLHNILERGEHESSHGEVITKQHMVECYLSLNRYADARDLARQVIQECRTLQVAHHTAYTLLHLSTAEAGLGNFAAAQKALAEAEPIFVSLGAVTWIAALRLMRGRIALKQGDARSAYEEGIGAAESFDADGQQVNFAKATLLQGQALFQLGDLEGAETSANKTLTIAKRYNVPALRYASYLLLGQVAETQHRSVRATHHYWAANSTIQRVQSGLTITLRPGFLEDKGEALRRIIALNLSSGNTTGAFEALERAKSQMWLGYLVNREHLRWSKENEDSRTLIEELERLRSEHQWFYRLAHDPNKEAEFPSAVGLEQALDELAVRERRMRAITEQLYLRSGGGQWADLTSALSVGAIQQALDEQALLIEYYIDGEQLWAFVMDKHAVKAHRLPLTVETLNGLISQLQVNLAAALKVGPSTPSANNLTRLGQRILQRLNLLLIEPLGIEQSTRKLIIVPYGALHFLPFHLLYDGTAYLIERHEVITLPAAGLATRTAPRRAPGALVLAHSWDGRLPHTHAEAEIVHQLFGGQLRVDGAAKRSALTAQPGQILHIAAHGQHRLDQPDLSYLQLADGQLYTDDVLQQDLSYELVTLSACETGRANVASDEELIGLGRGFLFAGAGALLLSLWGVADGSTSQLMQHLYEALSRSESKAAALRGAQRTMLAAHPNLHPAFWGAFQLIGDDSPLSVKTD